MKIDILNDAFGFTMFGVPEIIRSSHYCEGFTIAPRETYVVSIVSGFTLLLHHVS